MDHESCKIDIDEVRLQVRLQLWSRTKTLNLEIEHMYADLHHYI